MDETLLPFFQLMVWVTTSCLTVALVGLWMIARSIRRINIPADADFFTTLRYVPLIFVILLDLLDLSLDIFSAPITWIILDRLGMPNLRNKAAVEALIPFTGPIPTFTLTWIGARIFHLGESPRIPKAYLQDGRQSCDDYPT